jgi:uncharacterized RDD family membrane protein YckC
MLRLCKEILAYTLILILVPFILLGMLAFFCYSGFETGWNGASEKLDRFAKWMG